MDSANTEYEMTDADFKQISKIAGELTGIVLADHKRNMVYSRIARRVRATATGSFKGYLAYLESNKAEELDHFVNALTTNLTSLFRESHHFDYLRNELLPELRTLNQNGRKIRIWSAGCSIGQEAYSIAMCIKQAGFPSNWDIKILATDLDTNVLDTGRKGIYPASHLESVPEELAEKYFKTSSDGRSVQIHPGLRDMVHFKRLNLLEDWPIKGPMDFIFCRNVVIYFNKDTQRLLFNRYADLLPMGGRLFIGHSENLSGVCDRFEPLGQTIYRKIR